MDMSRSDLLVTIGGRPVALLRCGARPCRDRGPEDLHVELANRVDDGLCLW